MEVRMEYYLILAAVMFFAGVYGFITRRNLDRRAHFDRADPQCGGCQFRRVQPLSVSRDSSKGFFFTLFAIAIAAAETAVAIAIIINIYRNLRNIEVKNLDELKD